MRSDSTGGTTRDIPFSDADFSAIARLARSEFGLNLSESKKPLVYSRLSKRLKARNIDSFNNYLNLLNKNEEVEEKLELISALTTNVTSFYREKHHFETLTEESLSVLANKAKSNQRVRIWSAGCSSGQEPYSIAMTLQECIPGVEKLNVKVLATDIDPKIVSRARYGVYSMDEATGIPKETAKKYTKFSEKGELQICESTKQMITFAELNLMNEWPFNGPFDAIFCRNVAIYFDPETQQNLWSRFCDKLVPDGLLFIGHSERVTGAASNQLSAVGITTYRKSVDRNRTSLK